MRAWRDKDGSFLVEFEASGGKGFAQMAASGTVTGVFEPWGSSDAEYLYHYMYEVEGEALVEHVHMEVDTGRESRWINVVLQGLSPLTSGQLSFPALGTAEAAARFKQEQNRRAWAEQEQREAQRPRSLHHLPDLRETATLEVELFEEDDHVVARAGAQELWREPRIGWTDRREREVRDLLQERYGARFGGLVPRFSWDAR